MIDSSRGFAGNADVYGLGIRLGIYFQWAAQVIANFTLPNEVKNDMANAVWAFNLALVIADVAADVSESVHV